MIFNIRKIKRRALMLIALSLCVAMTLSGPAYPLAVHASLDDDEDISDSYDGDEDLQDEQDGFDEQEDDLQEEDSQEEASGDESSSVSGKYQGQIDKITDGLNDLKAEKAEIEKNIGQAKTAKDKELANKNYIDKQIYITESEISLLLERIELLEQDIEEKELDIEDKQAEYESNYLQFLGRLQSMQLNGESTKLGAILDSESLAEYITANEMMSRMAEYDKKLMQRIKDERIRLEDEKAQLDDERRLVEADWEETESKKKTLASQQQSAMLKIQDIAEMERQFTADLKKNQALQQQMQAELDQIYKQIEWDKNPYVGGEMLWPLPGYTNITSNYGMRFGNTDNHTGTDISGTGVHGASIVAANTGTVKFVNTAYVAGRGYGIYLIVDHGGGTTTLYAHCSKIVVSVGDVVQRGQKIAEVGSTGWSTGPHLHFEVRINGAHTNPMAYLKG